MRSEPNSASLGVELVNCGITLTEKTLLFLLIIVIVNKYLVESCVWYGRTENFNVAVFKIKTIPTTRMYFIRIK